MHARPFDPGVAIDLGNRFTLLCARHKRLNAPQNVLAASARDRPHSPAQTVVLLRRTENSTLMKRSILTALDKGSHSADDPTNGRSVRATVAKTLFIARGGK